MTKDITDDANPEPGRPPAEQPTMKLSPGQEKWLRDNRAAVNAWNEYVERYGLPLAEYRQF